MRRRSAQLAMTAVLFVLGVLVVVQFNAQTADQGLMALSVSELTELVANVTTRNNQLREEIATLERQRETVAAAVARGDHVRRQIRSDLNRVLGWSGALPVTGSGIRITVERPHPGRRHRAAAQRAAQRRRRGRSPSVACGSCPASSPPVPPAWSSSAACRSATPCELTAVGQPQVLAGSLTRAGGPIAQLAARFPDVVIGVVAVDRVTVPATDRDLTPAARPAPALNRPAPAPIPAPLLPSGPMSGTPSSSCSWATSSASAAATRAVATRG